MSLPCVVGTWAFSREPVRVAWEAARSGMSSLDAVERGINEAECDPSYGPYHVGCGGWRNEAGVLELDAAVMDGAQLDFGAVTALTGFSRAISVARQVLTHSKHNMLTGEGAALFAANQGFTKEYDLGTVWTAKTASKSRDRVESGHDTLGLLCVDKTGNICAGVSTSGSACKEPGRVGDSALPGCGLYADTEIGAACCSGDGDKILKHCPSYRVVGLIKQGHSPREACEQVVGDIQRRSNEKFEMVIVAVDKKGQVGAANSGVRTWVDNVSGVEYQGFPYVMVNGTTRAPEVHCVPPL